MDDSVRVLSADEIRHIAAQARAPSGGRCGCATLRCPGWEPVPASFDRSKMRQLGYVSKPDADVEPTLAEYHPAGTRYWSADAPIALGHFPYNRCEVWQCTGCGRAFLRYTEFGGYYLEHRIRELKAELIVDTSTPATGSGDAG